MYNMHHMRQLHETFVSRRSPAQSLTEFVLSHSSSPEYLVYNLSAILKAAEADLKADEEVFNAAAASLAGDELSEEFDS